MRKSNYSEAKRLAILAEHEKGESVDAICRKYQISAATFYNWKKTLSLIKKTIVSVALKSSKRKMPASKRCTPT